MSSVQDFDKAMTYVRGYLGYKCDAEALAVRPMWFCDFHRFAVGYIPPGKDEIAEPASYADMIELMSQDSSDQEALNMYNDRGGATRAEQAAEMAARARLRLMEALQQTVRRQYLGTGVEPRTSIDSHRYELTRKIGVRGLMSRANAGLGPVKGGE